ncbi:TPA: transposase [Klebsiella pneumoniae]|nr:transposase [Klebsiella pneumoniae]
MIRTPVTSLKTSIKTITNLSDTNCLEIQGAGQRGYSVAEVSDRLGVSAHSLYKWLRAVKPDNREQHARDLLEAKSEILKLRAQLKRTEEEREILKKAARYFAREPD